MPALETELRCKRVAWATNAGIQYEDEAIEIREVVKKSLEEWKPKRNIED